MTYADGSIKPYQLDRSFIRLLSKYGEIAASGIGWNWPGSGVWKWLVLVGLDHTEINRGKELQQLRTIRFIIVPS